MEHEERVRGWIWIVTTILIMLLLATGGKLFTMFSDLSWLNFLKGILVACALVITLLAFYRISRGILIWIRLFLYVILVNTKESVRNHIKSKLLLRTFNKVFSLKSKPEIYLAITKKFGYPDKQALIFLKFLSKKGDVDALNQLGGSFTDDYSYGYPESSFDFFPRVLKEPSRMFIQRRKLNQAKSSYNQEYVGQCYLYGDGVPKDSIQAIKWYRLASGNGSIRATSMIGHIYACGIGIPSNDKEAIYWLEKAANGINANGSNVKINLFDNAQHISDAQSSLGIRYFSGDGVIQDFNRAALWLRKAANFGNKYAQYHLGVIYAEGLGKNINMEDAVDWFTKAASQGHKEAQIRIGIKNLTNGDSPHH